jgi:hypothetical protein
MLLTGAVGRSRPAVFAVPLTERWRRQLAGFRLSRLGADADFVSGVTSPVLAIAGEFFVGRHYLHQGEHSVDEMLPHIADHQICPGL